VLPQNRDPGRSYLEIPPYADNEELHTNGSDLKLVL